MGKDDYFGSNMILFDSNTNMKVADAKIIRHDRDIQSIYISVTNFDLKNDEVYKILIIFEGRLFSYLGRTRGKLSDDVMEISLFNYSEVDLRGEPRFKVDKKGIAYRVRDIEEEVIIEKKMLMNIIDISKNGVHIDLESMELEKGFSFDFFVILDDKQIERLSARVVRKAKDDSDRYTYGCELYRANRENE